MGWSGDPTALGALLGKLGYQPGAEGELLGGPIKLRYCRTPFAWRLPTWDAHAVAHVEIPGRPNVVDGCEEDQCLYPRTSDFPYHSFFQCHCMFLH